MEQVLRAFAELVRSTSPFGLAGLAIVSLVVLVFRPSGRDRTIAWVAMALISILVVVDRLLPPSQIVPAKATDVAKIPMPTGEVFWTATGMQADWDKKDWAFTSGGSPKYEVTPVGSKMAEVLCDPNRIGSVAVCWDNKPSGYPETIKVTDIDLPGGQRPAQWCTYKEKSVLLSTKPDGSAPGNVFICARTVARN